MSSLSDWAGTLFLIEHAAYQSAHLKPVLLHFCTDGARVTGTRDVTLRTSVARFRAPGAFLINAISVYRLRVDE